MTSVARTAWQPWLTSRPPSPPFIPSPSSPYSPIFPSIAPSLTPDSPPAGHAMARRIADINPLCSVTCVDDFLGEDNAAGILAPPGVPAYDYVLDAVDRDVEKVRRVATWRSGGRWG